MRQHPFIAMGILLLLALLAFALAVHWLGWGWIGFTGYSPPTPQYQREKTLWDWLQLLIVPLVLVIGGFWLSQIQKTTEQQSTTDNQREAALQAYINEMSELLLHEKLRESVEDDEVRNIARVRTLTVIRRLDATRKASVLQFLHESGLIDKDKCIISLSEADLSLADLSFAHLSKADLNEAILTRANLNGADLNEAILNEVNLLEAKLKKANLKGAIGVTVEELEKRAVSLKGATMPDGSKHP